LLTEPLGRPPPGRTPPRLLVIVPRFPLSACEGRRYLAD
jgi:hypothetical protein